MDSKASGEGRFRAPALCSCKYDRERQSFVLWFLRTFVMGFQVTFAMSFALGFLRTFARTFLRSFFCSYHVVAPKINWEMWAKTPGLWVKLRILIILHLTSAIILRNTATYGN